LSAFYQSNLFTVKDGKEYKKTPLFLVMKINDIYNLDAEVFGSLSLKIGLTKIIQILLKNLFNSMRLLKYLFPLYG